MQEAEHLAHLINRVESGLFTLVLLAIALRAKKRGLNRWPYVLGAAAGFFILFLAAFLGLGFWALPLRWLWLGGVFVYVERYTRGGRKMSGTWQCPTCLGFNEATTLNCLCGYAQPDPNDGQGSAS